MNKKHETMAGWLFLMPALTIFAALVVLPVIMSLLLSFTEWNFLSGIQGIKWKSTANFIRLFTRDRKFMLALTNTVRRPGLSKEAYCISIWLMAGFSECFLPLLSESCVETLSWA